MTTNYVWPGQWRRKGENTGVGKSSNEGARNICAGPGLYTRKNACSVTAFNSIDIRSVQDNVATPVTAMMVTVCISTESSVFISPDLSDTNSFHQCCWSIMPAAARSYRMF